MKVTFCGATKTVTGSNFLVEGAGKKFLVDCGLYQGGAKDEIKNEEPFPYNINEIDFMLLTHAHIDHSGRIPKLYKEGYRNPIYATNATCDLCAIMLPDSGHIQETETEWKNRKRIRRGEEELVPIYDAETAAKSLELFKGEPYNQIIELDDDIHVRFNDAGHMLGSSTIEIWIRENGENKKIVFCYVNNIKVFFVKKKTNIYVINNGSSFYLKDNDFLEIYKNNKFMEYDDEISEYDFSRDDEYYGWKHK